MERDVYCLMCGRRFTAERSTARFCGPRCRKAWNRLHGGGAHVSVASAVDVPGPDSVAELAVRAHGVQAGFSAAAEAGVPSLRMMCRRVADGIGGTLEREGL
ncbi:hypothetical protein [Gordonibacter urolithinfaciens]|uniref:hypothetical protein n=1 Tax=Gordonibacter urolithinfaciens TaxID=1335613 RepID=UPI003A8D0E78